MESWQETSKKKKSLHIDYVKNISTKKKTITTQDYYVNFNKKAN